MAILVEEVYDAFRAAHGVTPEQAAAAARAILVERDQLVTKDYLEARLNALEGTFIKWAISIAVAMITILLGTMTLILRVMLP